MEKTMNENQMSVLDNLMSKIIHYQVPANKQEVKIINDLQNDIFEYDYPQLVQIQSNEPVKSAQILRKRIEQNIVETIQN